jgi:hypothetical protein
MFLRAVLMLSLLSSCCMAQTPQAEPQTAGRVLRADDGLPTEGAAITLELSGSVQHNGSLQTAITDSQGQYRFSDSIRADVTGFEPATPCLQSRLNLT